MRGCPGRAGGAPHGLLRAGELTPVWIPDLTHEAMRDLIRARAAAKRDSRVNRPGNPGD